MTLLIPAVWYRARAIIERRWGWSPVEEEVLLALRERPGTSASVAVELGIPRQVAEAAVSRLMRFGLIEVRIAPEPALAMTEAARAHLLAGRSLPERAQRREMTVSLVFDKLGGSVFRRRDVVIKPVKSLPKGATIIDFPNDDETETDSSMEERVRHLFSIHALEQTLRLPVGRCFSVKESCYDRTLRKMSRSRVEGSFF